MNQQKRFPSEYPHQQQFQNHHHPQQQPHQQHQQHNHHHHHQQQNYHQNFNTHILSSSLPNYSTISIKSEPTSNYNNLQTMETTRDNPMLTTAMPIPRKMISNFSDYGFDFEQSQSPQMSQDGTFTSGVLYGMQPSTTGTNTMWSVINDAMTISKQEPFQADDDDIFQVDKADLLQGPTLAELNSDTYLDDLNMVDFMLPPENSGLLLLSPSNDGQANSFNETSMPPQQLLQQQHNQTQQSHNMQQNHMQNNQQQQQQQQQQQLGITIGHDALLYDEQTNISTSPYDIYHSPAPKSVNSSAAFSPSSQASSSSPLLVNSISPPPYILNNNNININNNNTNNNNNNNSISHNKNQCKTLQELLKQESSLSPPEHSELGQSVPGRSILMSGSRNRQEAIHNRRLQFAQHGGNSRLSSSAPTNSSPIWETHIWQRREPRQHLLSTGSLAEAGSTSSLSTGGILSPEANDFSHDESFDDSDSDHYEDYSSDNDSDNEDKPARSSGSKKERYFWQYNVQAKGPKGQRLVIKTHAEDPHVLNEVIDPVFSPNCSVRGIKHSGKARKGDGNDITPNPRKLYNIGKELDKLGRTINDMTPVSELPFNVRPKSRKEKNKLASRACRLKKKAQHEANKIKLYGLETEHKRLISSISDIKKMLAYKFTRPTENTEDANQQIENATQIATSLQVAGTSTDFVNRVLEKVKAGVHGGGLNDI